MELIDKIKGRKQDLYSLEDLFSLASELPPDRALEELAWIRRQARALGGDGGYDLIRRTYLLGGRHSFDQYMIACEWDREPAARFWLPRRKVLEGKHKIASRIQAFMEDPKSLYLGFSLPPGTGKTTMIKFLLSFVAGKWPMSANMYVSYSDGMVKMMLDSVSAILTDTNEYAHNEIFPGNGGPAVSAEYKTVSYRPRGDFPTLGLVSLGGSVTGRTRANKFLVTDDLVKDAEMARSPERLMKLYEDYRSTLTTRMIGDKVKQIQLGTIWSVHDPISRMRQDHGDDPRYQFIAIPVEDENGESNFEYDHPDRYTKAKIADIKASLDPVDFSCLFLQRGMEKFGLAFPWDQLNYYNGVLPDGEPDNILFACDVAWGGGDSLSMPIAYVYGEAVYLHDVVFDSRDKFVTKPRVVGKILRHRCRMGRFEANNGGDEYCDDVGNALKEKGYSLNLSHKKAPTGQSKLARVEQFAPNIKTWYFRGEKCRDEEYGRFMRELTGFSFTAKNVHDDAADSCAQLADYMNTGLKWVTAGKRLF